MPEKKKTTDPSLEDLMKTSLIKVEFKESAGVVTINRPEKRNALNHEMFRTLYHLLQYLETRVSHVIIKGAGDKAFCAGGDVIQLSTGPYETSKDILHCTLASFELVSNYKIPYIAIMNGICMGGGSSYSIAGRYRISTEKTIYAMPETIIGFFNDSGASYFLSRMPYNVGVYIGLTGARLKGYELNKVGLATHFVESYKVEALEKALISCRNKKEIEEILEKFSSVPENATTELDILIPKIEKCFGAESVEEIYENLRNDGSDWARKTIEILDKMSPTSLKVSLRNIIEGKTMSLVDSLVIEYRVGAHHLIKSDLSEGVRALLIDKDMKPKWNPGTVEEVTDEVLDRFYEPLPLGDDLEFGNKLKNKL